MLPPPLMDASTDRAKPRNVAGPVVRGADFWGREDEVGGVWRMLEHGSVLVTAPRRHGKSSLMSALADAPQPGWTVCHLDVEAIETPPDFLTELTAALLQKEPFRRVLKRAKGLPGQLQRWLATTLESLSFEIAGAGEIKLSLREGLAHSDRWPELAEQLFSVLQTVGGDVLLIVDEFPMMVASFLDRDESAAISFLKWFRAQRQNADRARVRLLLGGSVNIEPRLEALGRQALINDLQRFRLDQMSPTRRLEFVVSVLEGERAVFQPETPAEIVRVADCGIHFFLQVLISECLLESRRIGTALVSAQIEPIYRERVIGPPNRARFSHYLSRLKENYGGLEQSARIVLGALARQGRLTDGALSALLRESGETAEALPHVLMLLESDYYVLRDAQGIWISSGFLRDWWLRNVPVSARMR